MPCGQRRQTRQFVYTSANVSTTLTMTDDASGVSTPTVDMTSPTGFLRSGSCVLSSGTLLNRTYQCTGTLPQYSESGVWQFSVRLRDVAGNTTTVTNAQLVTLGFTASFTNASQPGINLPTLVRVNDPALSAGCGWFQFDPRHNHGAGVVGPYVDERTVLRRRS